MWKLPRLSPQPPKPPILNQFRHPRERGFERKRAPKLLQVDVLRLSQASQGYWRQQRKVRRGLKYWIEHSVLARTGGTFCLGECAACHLPGIARTPFFFTKTGACRPLADPA